MTINIKISPWHSSSPEEQARDAEGMDRDGHGYREGMTLEEIYRCNHGYYVMDARRAEREKFATWSFRGDVKLAVRIGSVRPVKEYRGLTRYVIEGNIIRPGDPDYERLYSMVIVRGIGSKNPVSYEDDDRPAE